MDIKGNNKVTLGIRKEDGVTIYITKPSFDCGWYWSFGYLGNKNEHYHLKDYQSKTISIKDSEDKFHIFEQKRNLNMFDALREDYELNPCIEENLWQFCELAATVYTLKETAEVFGRGGSHYTSNPCFNVIINKAEVKRINEIVLPEVLQTFWNLLSEY
jgi:hypothetical protein